MSDLFVVLPDHSVWSTLHANSTNEHMSPPAIKRPGLPFDFFLRSHKGFDETELPAAR